MNRDGGGALLPEFIDATRLWLNVIEIMRENLPELPVQRSVMIHIFILGVSEYAEEIRTEAFSVAVEKYLQTKTGLRRSSRQECSGVLRRLIREVPDVAQLPLRLFRPRDCVSMILKVYHTPHTINKARRLLHCFFRYAQLQNWCQENPVERMQQIRLREQRVDILTLPQIQRLLYCLTTADYKNCAAVVGLMLWAGIRPIEVTRLRWSDVNLTERVVSIQPMHSKTGGARHVTLQPVLVQWLRRCPLPADGESLVVPPAWTVKWRRLRDAAGLTPWRSDTLRHTFASYHLRYFRDIYRLQMEMGHSSARLLFSRYLNMRHISHDDAVHFWNDLGGKCL